MAGVYTPSSIAIQDHRLAIKIHERPPCNFVFTCLYALIRSGIRPIPEFEHFPRWAEKSRGFFCHYPLATKILSLSLSERRVGGGAVALVIGIFFSFSLFHESVWVTTHSLLVTVIFLHFSHSLGISLNRATFSHFSPWIFDNFDHDLPPSRLFREHFTSPRYTSSYLYFQSRNIFFRHRDSDLYQISSRRPHENFPKVFNFPANKLQTRQRNGAHVGCGFSVWLVEIRLSKGCFHPSPILWRALPPLIPSTSTVT